VKCEQCPVRFFLGEQAEVLIQVATLKQARLVPEAAVSGYDGFKGTVWTVEDGRMRRRVVSFGHRTEDARLEIKGGLPSDALVVTETNASFQEGRAARVVREGKQ
jgi:HlyD family secretion protein